MNISILNTDFFWPSGTERYDNTKMQITEIMEYLEYFLQKL